MSDLRLLADKLSTPAREALERACVRCKNDGHHLIDVEHWLLELAENENSDFAKILEHFHLDKEDLRKASLARNPGDDSALSFSRDLVSIWETAAAYAPFGTPIRSALLLCAVFDHPRIRDRLATDYAAIATVDIEILRLEWRSICAASSEGVAFRPAIESHAIFLSYRRGPSSIFSERIYDNLQVKFGEEKIFFDIDAIPPGQDFRAIIERQIQQCRVLLVIVGPDTIGALDAQGRKRIHQATDYIRIEIGAALKNNLPIVPALVEDASMPSPDDLPEDIKEFSFKQATAVRRHPDFRKDMERLVQCLEAYVIGA